MARGVPAFQLLLTDSKRAAIEEGDREDRISAFPVNVIDHILELLPVKDAAKTSILSKQWRYVWSMLPNLVLDKLFCDNLSGRSHFLFSRTIDKILLHHLGDILKFHLDVSGVHLYSHADVDTWMLYVTRKYVKQLTLNMPTGTYKVPSYIFNCQTLTHLELSNCVFKPPNAFVGFVNLTELHLRKITFMPTSEFCFIKAPVLTRLTLKKCDGTQYLNIISPELARLAVRESYYLELNCFTNCKKLNVLLLARTVVDNRKYVERSTLEKLLLNLPALKALHLGAPLLELLSADTVPKELCFTLNLIWHLSFSIDFSKLGQTSYALRLMRHSPNLRILELWDIATRDNAQAVLEYLSATACWEHQSLDKLNLVTIHLFKGSTTELLFARLLLAVSPSLISMTIKCSRALGSMDVTNITTMLMLSHKASSEAQIFCLPCVS